MMRQPMPMLCLECFTLILHALFISFTEIVMFSLVVVLHILKILFGSVGVVGPVKVLTTFVTLIVSFLIFVVEIFHCIQLS
jgi:hypothetical protein